MDPLGSGDFFVMNAEVLDKQLIYEFDSFRVDPSAFRLLNDGSAVSIEPKALQLLVFLIENRGRLLEKQPILDAVWRDLSVTENALTREIAILRRTLSDDTRQPRFIETVPTRGYRFIANIREVPRGVAPEPQRTKSTATHPSQQHRFTRLAALAVAAVVVILALMYGLRQFIDHRLVFSPASGS